MYFKSFKIYKIVLSTGSGIWIKLCNLFLTGVQEKLGILNGGVVYAVFDYDAKNEDELSFRLNDQITVLRKGDEKEKEWWWSRLGNKEGYIPKNLLGVGWRQLTILYLKEKESIKTKIINSNLLSSEFLNFSIKGFKF